MPDRLESLDPRSLWSHFASLAAIPRPSGQEERAAAFVIGVAERAGAKVRRDARGNIVARVPASPGRERAATVVLQSHLDMVCEKNRGVAHDFERDPIHPRLDGEWVRATGTTLGADNGIGVAASLAAATDPAVVHGPLELLFTLDEETGLTGAAQLDPAILSGRILLNLDSEEDGTIFVGCAGGEDTLIDLPVSWTEAPAGEAFRLEVSGLKGGHSGLNIVENRGNALKLLARILDAAIESGVAFDLASVAGGSKHNAIPREAEAVLVGGREGIERLARASREVFLTELAGIDDGLAIAAAGADRPKRVLSPASRDSLVRLMMALPHGVLGMSRDIPGLVETSSNLAVVAEREDAVRVVTSSRSSIASALTGVLDSIRASVRLTGASFQRKDGYPGWKPNLDSKALEVVRAVYRDRWGRDPHVTAIHAGLECGLLGERVPGLDMVSFGPQIEGAHSPDERVSVPSVARFWGALGEVLGRLSA
jgi:dipeptidase D